MNIWERIFGANWRTSLSALVAFVFFAATYILHNQPQFLALAFLSPGVKHTVIAICEFIGFLGMLMFAYHTKDALTTGTGEHSLMLGHHRSRPVKDNIKVLQWVIIALVLYLVVVMTFLMHRAIL